MRATDCSTRASWRPHTAGSYSRSFSGVHRCRSGVEGQELDKVIRSVRLEEEAWGRTRAEELRSKNLSNKRALQPESFFLLGANLLTNEVVPFSKRIPHALRTDSVATTTSRNIQIGCSRMRTPNQMT